MTGPTHPTLIYSSLRLQLYALYGTTAFGVAGVEVFRTLLAASSSSRL